MEKLGINFLYLIAQIVNFGIILFLLQKVLYKPILNVLDERRKKVEDGVKYSERMEKEFKEIKAGEERVLSDARREAQKIIEHSRISAEKVEKELMQKARVQADELIKQAKAAIEEERKRAIRDIEKQAAELIIASTKRVLEDTLDEREQHEIIQRALITLKDEDKFKFG